MNIQYTDTAILTLAMVDENSSVYYDLAKPVAINSSLIREHEEVKLTYRSLSDRLAEIIDRLAIVVEASLPDLPPEAWELICWEGRSCHNHQRSFQHPPNIDPLAWKSLAFSIADWIEIHHRNGGFGIETSPPAWTEGLFERLMGMTIVERIAVLERIEASARAEQARDIGLAN